MWEYNVFMPSSKIFSIIILCVAVVVSTWLLREKPVKTGLTANKEVVSAQPYENVTESSNQWKKILTSVDTKNQDILINLSNNGEGALEETTLTAQAAKDIFSLYLTEVKGNETFSAESVDKIYQNILSSPNYTTTKGVIYLATNLKISPNNDRTAIENYQKILDKSLYDRMMQTRGEEDPLTALSLAVEKSDENGIVKLESTIKALAGFVSDLLQMTVPSSAAEIHLGLLNATSNVASDVLAIKGIYIDPIKSFASMSQYSEHIENFITALGNINAFFEQKLGSSN